MVCESFFSIRIGRICKVVVCQNQTLGCALEIDLKMLVVKNARSVAKATSHLRKVCIGNHVKVDFCTDVG